MLGRRALSVLGGTGRSSVGVSHGNETGRTDAHDARRFVDCRPNRRFFSCCAAFPCGDGVGGHVGGGHMALHATVAVGFRPASLARSYANDTDSAVPRAGSAFNGHQLDRYSRQPSW